MHCVVKDLDKKQRFLETHFGCEASPPTAGAGTRDMVDSAVRRLEGREAIPWVERGEMIGVLALINIVLCAP